ncbi:cytochrome bd-I ubiquinol oxidase subunit 2 apoprotein [Apibacter mensalis]|uniref:Cytochrome bd-I ubiquinol oxidase subunit 2 apoprotein n=1 Tax=Apibacter mensalis TaxID=1586267 RepID=A0A0X3AMT3_9FLAO|nr:cytochrome d ubiquinol oxidase subunit II [Apibacter mensalis]CVK15700.1 cytochrome bd-I ubiquinol oxidase subunit 2 apoprotein [Apibacter mensalis]
MFYLYVVIFFLWTAIALYLLLGGADFGVGILELFSKHKNEKRIEKIMYEEMGPVWEANHMWLIIVIVILFVGFPDIYAVLSTYLHIPLLLMLIGIIARGTAFSFRNYDAVKDHWQYVYNKIFRYSSVITPFFLGMIAAATVSGTIDVKTNDFMAAYIWSWLTPFGCALGVFTCSICGYLAVSYSLSQVKNYDDLEYLTKKLKIFLFVVIASGGLVFVCAYFSCVPLIQWIFGETVGWIAVSLATVSVFGTLYSLKEKKYSWIRVLAGFQVLTILFAVTYQHYPNLVILKQGSLSLIEDQYIHKTIAMLAWALMLGSIFILPGVFHLIYSFQKRR